MPQLVLPIFPQGATQITPELTFEKRDGWVTYFHGLMPVFRHEEDDVQSFRMITSQFCANGNAKQAQITKAFGVPAISVKRSVKLYREKGPSGFFSHAAHEDLPFSRQPSSPKPKKSSTEG